MKHAVTISAVSWALLLSAVPAVSAPQRAEEEFFERQVRPVLVEHCQSCHGEAKQENGLRLDSRAALLSGGVSGPAAVAGDVEASRFIAAIRHTGDLKMPPRTPLSAEQVAALEQWVRDGLVWPGAAEADTAETMEQRMARARTEHWAFQPLKTPPIPAIPAATPIDAFIQEGLERAGLAAAPATDKRTLLRRTSYDLIGLPPTPEEMNAFLADESPEAFSRMVDRLLASPHYGERWGRHWLDVVRYTDSFDSRATYKQDVAEAWKYRDWVVDAFNRDMPYDAFVQHQIAGDLLPAPDGSAHHPEGIIATGMLAIGNWPGGDADKEKMVTDIVDDQIDVVTRGIMGVTFTCARCHDHKFDPFTARDYYGLAGIFFSSHIMPEVGPKAEGSPVLHIPLDPPEALAEREAHAQALATAEGELQGLYARNREAAVREGLNRLPRYLRAAIEPEAAAHDLHPGALRRWQDILGLLPYRLLTRFVTEIHGQPGLQGLFDDADTPSVVVNATAQEQKFLSITQPPHSLVLHPGPATAVAAVWRSPFEGPARVIAQFADADATCGEGIAWRIEHWRGPAKRVLLEGTMPNGGAALINGLPGSEALEALPVLTDDLLLLLIAPGEGHACDSTAVEFQIGELAGKQRIWNLTGDALAFLAQTPNPLPDHFGGSATWEFGHLDAPALPEGLEALAPLRDALASGEQDTVDLIAAAESLKLAAVPESPLHLWLTGSRGPFAVSAGALPLEQQVAARDLQARLAALRARTFPPLVYANGVREGGVPGTPYEGFHDAAIHIRGDYNRLSDVVPRGFPEVLAHLTPAMPAAVAGSGRRELAEWITRPEHPLTARVMVNRVWLHHFGQGLVRTPGDFGLRGETPTHPELLDYLATEFVRSGWSLKQLHRSILLSQVYQRSSSATAEMLAQDPENRLWARMERRRLEAETLRDAMVFVAGSLEPRLGGEPFTDLLTPRRTIYFKTVRSDRSSYPMLFDAADPTSIISQREQSLVAPQALFLLNNPLVLEMSGRLAKRAMQEGGETREARLNWLYQHLYGRPPLAEELTALEDLMQSEDAAAWAQVCQMLLCANEFMFIE